MPEVRVSFLLQETSARVVNVMAITKEKDRLEYRL
jgi:hypothetical protein